MATNFEFEPRGSPLTTMSTPRSPSTKHESDMARNGSQGSYTHTNPLAVEVLQGKERVVCFPGTSQFRVQGVSACGLAALNFARISFRIADSCRSLLEALDRIASRETVEEVIAICAGWSSELHLEVEEITQIPLFEHTLKHRNTSYGEPRASYFRQILRTMELLRKSAAVIITRPPEIIACVKVTDASSGQNAYIVFDSHPRPSHPQGAGLILSSSLENTAKILRGILHVDKDLISSPDLQWEAQLLTNCSGHVFVAKRETFDADKSTLESSLAVLALCSEVKELKRQNDALACQNGKLEEEVASLENAVQQEKLKSIRAATYTTPLTRHDNKQDRRGYTQPNAVAGPSRLPINSHVPSYNGAKSIFADNPPPVPTTKPTTYEFEDDLLEKMQFDLLKEESEESTIQNLNAALKLQRTFDAEDAALRYQQAELTTYSRAKGVFTGNPPPVFATRSSMYESEDDRLKKMQINLLKEESKEIRNLHAALKFQRTFDAEDAVLRSQQAELATHLQRKFDCGICLEELPEDDSARVDGCGHMMCRSCMRGFITAKIAEHRFPILCPICTAGDGGRPAAEISGLLVEQIGVTEEEYGIWIEMELAQFSILLHCRKCNRSTFVDRDDHNDMPNLVCPLPDCDHIWCKSCHSSIEIGGPKHSCDGSSELDHLMKEQGWKYCPNCKTPILKDHGCNHMTCIATGCNTHFCYVCGDLIVRSALRDEINKAVSEHYSSKCQLFYVPE
ncbi:hypothetical protein V8B97DRAFT_1918955 [Scleroderma yunnanense]